MAFDSFGRTVLTSVALAASIPAAALAAEGKPASAPAASASAPTAPDAAAEKAALDKWCSDVAGQVNGFGWKIRPCRDGIAWKVGGWSHERRPLIYGEFGDPKSSNVTLVLTMVHSDEITPLYLGLNLAHWMMEHPETLKDSRVVIAPLVNPDGLYRDPRTRTNARGVDVNRNFPTQDWKDQALASWKKRFNSNPRRYPGAEGGSELETRFQQELIRLVRPEKILSVHSPLNMTDYDGPTTLSLAQFPKQYVTECLKLSKSLKARHYGFYPGSLGNYAGQELGIPTITLELPTADPRQARAYWLRFQSGIQTMIQYRIPDVQS